MEDLFEMMMESTQRSRRKKRRQKNRPSQGGNREGSGMESRLEGNLLREALGGSFLAGQSGEGSEASWQDLDHALAGRSYSKYRTEDEDFSSEEWSGEAYNSELRRGHSEEEEDDNSAANSD